MRPRFILLGLPVLLALLLTTGCGGDRSLLLTAETNDSNYGRGKELLKRGQDHEALAAFLKVIATRGDDAAPESHLEAGLLYAEKLKDPIAAIYHYRKFCELVPASPQTPLVRQQIDAALRDFARTLPGQPLENQSAGLLATAERLQAENKQLRDQLSAMTGGRSGRPSGPTTLFTPASTPYQSPIRPAPPPPTSTRSEPVPLPAAPAAPITRKHVVATGDTLSKIALQYYGDRSKYLKIFEANHDVMKNENKLPPIGTELKIPQ